MLQAVAFVYGAVTAADGWYWTVIVDGKVLDSGKQATQMGALKQAAQKLKAWADAQP